MLKFTYNIIISLLLLSIIVLATFNTTIEGLASDSYKANNVDVIYHNDETKDYSKLLKNVMDNNDVKNAFTGFETIREKIKADPTILIDLKNRLATDIETYKNNPIKSTELSILISKLETTVIATDYIVEKGPAVNTTVKDFRALYDLVMKKGGAVDTIINETTSYTPTEQQILNGIQNKIKNNPEILENPSIRLNKEINEFIELGTITSATFTGTILDTTLSVTTRHSGTISIGQVLTGDDIADGIYIKEFITTTDGGSGGIGTYIINKANALPQATKIISENDGKAKNKVIMDGLINAINKAVNENKNKYIKQLNITDKLGAVTYNEPGYFRFGPSSYVPNYEDSVYLSRLTSIDWRTPVVDLSTSVGNSGAKLGGFCAYNKLNPTQIELECNKLNTTTCASTSCCTLLGGVKCVSGNEGGPAMKSNFSDIYIKNKDHYYYQGKCYGNCII